MTVNINDVIEIACRMEANGVEDVVNVFQFKNNTGVALSDTLVNSAMLTFLETCYSNLVGAQSNTFIYRDVTFRNVTQAILMGIYSWPTLVAGLSASPQQPPGVAGLVNFVTSIPKVVLRKYIGGLVTTLQENDGSFTSTLTSALVAFASAVMTGPSGGLLGMDYGYLSPKTLNFEMPNSAVVTDIPAYQRRRKQGRGS